MKKEKKTNKNQPLTISVVIGAYNEEKYIGRALKQLSEQTRKPDEIIVVNNNSTDETANIAKSFGAKVITEKQQGYVYSVNRGLMNARCDIVAVTDADTIVPLNWLEGIEKEFHDPEVVGVANALNSWDSKTYSLVARFFFNPFALIHFLLNIPVIGGIGYATRRDVLHAVGGYDLTYKIGADWDLGMRLKSMGKVRFLSNISVKTSGRRFHNDAIRSVYQYTKTYFYTIWFRKPIDDSLQPYR